MLAGEDVTGEQFRRRVQQGPPDLFSHSRTSEQVEATPARRAVCFPINRVRKTAGAHSPERSGQRNKAHAGRCGDSRSSNLGIQRKDLSRLSQFWRGLSDGIRRATGCTRVHQIIVKRVPACPRPDCPCLK